VSADRAGSGSPKQDSLRVGSCVGGLALIAFGETVVTDAAEMLNTAIPPPCTC